MNPFILEETDDTPKIVFDPANDLFEMSGRSLPEDSTEFYEPVLNWLEEYGQNPNPSSAFHFKLEYFNTASSKLILEVFFALENVEGAKVIWYYDEEDEDMEEAGEEYQDLVDVDFEFQVY